MIKEDILASVGPTKPVLPTTPINSDKETKRKFNPIDSEFYRLLTTQTKEDIKKLPKQETANPVVNPANPDIATYIATQNIKQNKQIENKKEKKEDPNKIKPVKETSKENMDKNFLDNCRNAYSDLNKNFEHKLDLHASVITEEKAYLDKYYTNPEVAKYCIKFLNLKNYDRIIEPSAGNGSFSKQIPNCEAYDLAPEDSSIKKQDFLKFKTDKGNILVIGNPPFGDASKLAIQFINHAATFARTIAFILPSTFAKMSVLKKLDSHIHLRRIEPLPSNAFLVNGKPYKVDCHFFIFDVKGKEREFTKSTTDDFIFTNKANADFAILRKGYNYGKIIPLDDTHYSDASKYWIKSRIGKNNLKKRLENLTYDTASYTLGSESISQSEIIDAYNKR